MKEAEDNLNAAFLPIVLCSFHFRAPQRKLISGLAQGNEKGFYPTTYTLCNTFDSTDE